VAIILSSIISYNVPLVETIAVVVAVIVVVLGRASVIASSTTALLLFWFVADGLEGGSIEDEANRTGNGWLCGGWLWLVAGLARLWQNGTEGRDPDQSHDTTTQRPPANESSHQNPHGWCEQCPPPTSITSHHGPNKTLIDKMLGLWTPLSRTNQTRSMAAHAVTHCRDDAAVAVTVAQGVFFSL
jgi:hypothetical protein